MIELSCVLLSEDGFCVCFHPLHCFVDGLLTGSSERILISRVGGTNTMLLSKHLFLR